MEKQPNEKKKKDKKKKKEDRNTGKKPSKNDDKKNKKNKIKKAKTKSQVKPPQSLLPPESPNPGINEEKKETFPSNPPIEYASLKCDPKKDPSEPKNKIKQEKEESNEADPPIVKKRVSRVKIDEFDESTQLKKKPSNRKIDKKKSDQKIEEEKNMKEQNRNEKVDEQSKNQNGLMVPLPKESLQKTQSDPLHSAPLSNPLANRPNSMTKLPNSRSGQLKSTSKKSSLIVKNNSKQLAIHPLSLAKIDGDLIGRTGMYLERSGMSAAKKRAFDWLGLNRHQYQQKSAETVKNIEIALSDVGISKELILQTLQIFLTDNQMTEIEVDSIKKELFSNGHGDFITMSKAAWIMKDNCKTYQRPQDQY
ncbi:unnamed protein product [Caenorhabditis angaria]|uniref:Uncharacterized protein n=1 Tax=Caenorhabditis angaria TaxID=860376 RepID=A0A9P1I2N5_9PELO|nr:unnamed protein product [Caenorhabditis angaria]